MDAWTPEAVNAILKTWGWPLILLIAVCFIAWCWSKRPPRSGK